MKRFSLKAAAVALALVVPAVLAAPQQAQAGKTGAIIAGSILGGIALGAIAHGATRGYYYNDGPVYYRPAYRHRHGYRREFRRIRRACARNWGYDTRDYYGCLNYYGY